MASITPLLDRQLENPMVTGYGFREELVQLAPIELAYCPRCKSKWVKMPEGLADDSERPWETNIGGVWVTAPAHPVGARYCRTCAIYAATVNDLIAYVEERKLQQSAIEYAIIGCWDWEKKLDPDWVPWLWNNTRMKLYEEGRLRDFVQQEHGDDFAGWMMERSRK